MGDTTLLVTDSAGAQKTLSMGQDAGNSNALTGKTTLIDPVSGVDHLIREDGAAYIAEDGKRATYRAAISAVTPIATPTQMVTVKGSATKVVSIKKIRVSGAATAAGSMPITLNRRSTAGTDGSATRDALTACKMNTSTAATAVVDKIATANQGTPGTLVACLGARRLNMVALGSAATSGEGAAVVWDFPTPLVLASDSEFLTLNGEGAAVPSGGVFDFEIEWTEHTA